MTVGEHVVYVDPTAIEHDALVTAVWGDGPVPSLNVVYVSSDESATDQYGRQLAQRATSVVHKSNQAAHGAYWREP